MFEPDDAGSTSAVRGDDGDRGTQGAISSRLAESLDMLRSQLRDWRSQKSLPPETTDTMVLLCSAARDSGWTPEQLVVAVKDVCYSSPEVTGLTTTSERDNLLAKVVTACIKEYFRGRTARQ